ncbi:type IV secretory system conjugative DNA transfer family protein [Deinococcus soli (ex Cha et al. 2016)]|uniref:Type IV secretion system protein VirD4 n=2 Tax=Deinococcus soli (ex Cha et al. 2016) TaxID=1309411 RepID=A0ACC6KGJ3_9DEIO|nr:type IV secretory system conjugative DNA transfer family protein [Deinococcus soli (ex Cha et al. 2016)]MDR6218519.1 type IV secretion system protein VirD4 [Deinococcus soli (ex Cha et al. 2016)]MDR6329259.1 type IV secretion system protein VirD4 [Deinococcus soli (ex Cha et al. 2016)]MDR6751532.1 type IV secretion system protein VirD4 [Deinococcus soli (ex Cha et al. 2016)]
MNKFRLLVLLSLGTAAYGGYVMYQTTINTATAFLTAKPRAGQLTWAQVLKMKKADPSMFTYKCLNTPKCAAVYNNQFKKNNPIWTWVLLGLGFAGALIFKKLGKPKDETEDKKPGGARWADDEDLAEYIEGELDWKSGKRRPDLQRGYLGMMHSGKILRAPERMRNAHSVVIGGPGARKSTGYHKPNLMLDAIEGTCSVVIDLKYPDPESGFFDMVPAFYNMNRNIQVFAPFDTTSMRLNLLQNATDVEGAYTVAMMIIPQRDNEGGAAFYKNIERTILAALLLGVATSETPSMQQAFKIVLRGAAAIKEFISKHPDPVVRETAAAMMELDNKTLTGIAASLTNALQIFNHPALARATTPKEGENLDLEGFFENPGLLYIGVQQSEIRGGKGQTLLQLIKRAVDDAMLKHAKKNGGRMKHHTAFYLDEFANMGPLPNVAENFATMRSYRVSYHVTLQNLSQGEVLYGREGFRSFFNNNLQHIIFFPRATKMDDAVFFSKYLGMATRKEHNVGESYEPGLLGMRGGTRYSESDRESAIELLSPAEMLNFPGNEAIIFTIGSPAARILMPRMDEGKIAAMVFDPKTRKYKAGKKYLANPLHMYYKELLEGVDPKKFMEELLGSDGSRLVPDEEIALSDEEELRAWAEQIAEYGAEVAVFEERNRYTVFTKNLPPDLANPAAMKLWETRNWVNVHEDAIKLTNQGALTLGPLLLEKIKRLRWKGKLMLWISRNADFLENHPLRKHKGEPLPPAEGYYEEEAVLMTISEFRNVFEVEPPEEILKERSGKRFFRVPINDDDFLRAMHARKKAESGAGEGEKAASGPQGGSKPQGGKPQGNKPQGGGKPQAAKAAPPKPAPKAEDDPDMPELPDEDMMPVTEPAAAPSGDAIKMGQSKPSGVKAGGVKIPGMAARPGGGKPREAVPAKKSGMKIPDPKADPSGD